MQHRAGDMWYRTGDMWYRTDVSELSRVKWWRGRMLSDG